jgi:hypothetical protein
MQWVRCRAPSIPVTRRFTCAYDAVAAKLVVKVVK